jgi:hypothetical protein
MSFIDVAIPAVVGLVALVWPHTFLQKPDQRKVRLVRLLAGLLLVITAGYLVLRLIRM